MLDSLTSGGVNRTREYALDISGKGINVTRALHTLGENAIHLTHLGGRLERFFKAKAREESLRLHAVRADTEIRICVTLVEKTRRLTTEIVEDGAAVDEKAEGKIRRAWSALLPRCRAVIISGSKAAGYSDRLFPDLVRAAREAGKFTMLDFRGKDLENSLPYGPDVIKPNFQEFVETFFPAPSGGERHRKIQELVEEKMIALSRECRTACIVTDGPRPILYTEAGTVHRLTPEPLSPLNTTGCGDVFAAGFAAQFMKTGAFGDAVRFAAGCARKSALSLRPGFLD